MPPDSMLETTFTTEFAPGTNLPGGVSGANWAFLLPRLELERIVCFGPPADPALARLARIAEDVVVVCSGRSQLHRAEGAARRLGGGGIRACSRSAARSLEDGSADLVVAEGRRADVAELRRLVKPGGLVYSSPAIVSRLELGGSSTRAAYALAVAPRRGEVQNATPAEDRELLDYMLDHPAYCPSFRRGVLRRAHRAASRRQILSPLTRRESSFAGAGDAALPAYLREIAASAGIDLDGRRFGLSARGRFSSRKVLFLVFDAAGETLEYIVKITREPDLNGRLENEHRALTLLELSGVRDLDTLPRAAFFGYHGGLAVLGETVVDGRPFELPRESPSDSPALRAAVDWLVELGAVTAPVVDPQEVSARLERLLARFVEVYRPGEATAGFLAAQIETIAQSRSPFSLAFQHGDPHTGNVLLTPAGRVVFLDWEAAESQGMPLWDLFHFMRGCANLATRGARGRDALAGFRRFYLADSELGRLLCDATRTLCEHTGLAGELVEPLLYTCWMHRALKEATRLPAERLGEGRFLSLLRLCIAEREAPGLIRLFSAGKA